MKKMLSFPLVLFLSTFTFVACDNDPDADDVGDALEDTLEEVEDEVD